MLWVNYWISFIEKAIPCSKGAPVCSCRVNLYVMILTRRSCHLVEKSERVSFFWCFTAPPYSSCLFDHHHFSGCLVLLYTSHVHVAGAAAKLALNVISTSDRWELLRALNLSYLFPGGYCGWTAFLMAGRYLGKSGWCVIYAQSWISGSKGNQTITIKLWQVSGLFCRMMSFPCAILRSRKINKFIPDDGSSFCTVERLSCVRIINNMWV